jgi:hypothetical protein
VDVKYVGTLYSKDWKNGWKEGYEIKVFDIKASTYPQAWKYACAETNGTKISSNCRLRTDKDIEIYQLLGMMMLNYPFDCTDKVTSPLIKHINKATNIAVLEEPLIPAHLLVKVFLLCEVC